MSIVRVKLRPSYLREDRKHNNEDILALAVKHYADYEALDRSFMFPEESMEAAEHMFDLTNNPSKEEERAGMYGPHRSVAVGDIIEVTDDENSGVTERWVCMPVGWEPIFVATE